MSKAKKPRLSDRLKGRDLYIKKLVSDYKKTEFGVEPQKAFSIIRQQMRNRIAILEKAYSTLSAKDWHRFLILTTTKKNKKDCVAVIKGKNFWIDFSIKVNTHFPKEKGEWGNQSNIGRFLKKLG